MALLKKLSLVFLLLLGFKASAQYQKSTLEVQTDSLVAALRSQRIDTICITESYCVGCRGSRVKDDSPCATKGILTPTYIFWKRGRATYAAYLDNCSKRKSVEINESGFWKYMVNNQQRITTEEIKPFTINEHGKLEGISRNHGMKYSYTFFIRQDTISQYFDGFDLIKKTKLSYKQVNNIYYKKNKMNPIWKIVPLLRQAVMEADKKWGISQN
jgi:hypothetical protein